MHWHRPRFGPSELRALYVSQPTQQPFERRLHSRETVADRS